MNATDQVKTQLHRLVGQSDWRYAIGLVIRFNKPTLLFQTYPQPWLDYYAKHGLLFFDPILKWGMENIGTCDWASLKPRDDAGVMERAATFGLVHGIIVSVGSQKARSVGFFAHADRPITVEETAVAQDVMEKLHDLSMTVADLDPAALAPLLALNQLPRDPSTQSKA
jgi:LuxR family transcriptional regulator